ncbi:MAG: DUF1501 domain-containing protein [Enhydrobacter sp.]|nr:MAG: DUF1501 domain-containing protein [Enhydrobacter sp.]
MRPRTLILVELNGGNDGLNTIVPFGDALYRDLRGGLAVPRERVIPLDENVGLHEKLAPLTEAWKARDLAIVQGVGYPNTNRSHFRSIEIWDTASAATQTLGEGWVAQAFRGADLPQGAGVDAIVADNNSLPVTGRSLRTIVMQDAEVFLRQSQAMKDRPHGHDGGNPALRHVLAVRREVNGAASGLRDRLRDVPPPAFAFNQDGNLLGRELDLATRLVLSRLPVIVVKVALGGFDTHANQAPIHERLLGILAGNLATLRRNLIASGQWNDVLVLTYSEFGRRVRPNASGGTDHGAAAPLFVMGGRVAGGLHAAHPSLSDLQDGDLRHAVDFRSVFSAVARDWWGRQSDFGLRQPDRLSFIRT